jgi:hypothetical protein
MEWRPLRSHKTIGSHILFNDAATRFWFLICIPPVRTALQAEGERRKS